MDSKKYSDHRKEQILRWASTTYEQRLQFVENALEFAHSAGINYLEIKHKLAQRNKRKLRS